MKLITKPRKKDVSESNIKFEGLNRKDQIFKKPARLQRRNQKEQGKFDNGKDNSIVQNTMVYNQWRSRDRKSTRLNSSHWW